MTGQVKTRILQFICILLVSVISLRGQNIAPNPDLEFYTFCPTNYAFPGDPLPCVPWQAGTFASTDYLNSCSNPSNVGVPSNFKGWQFAHSGEGYCGFFLKGDFVPDYREYLTAPLLQPLIGGKWYYVSFYISLANQYCGIEKIGAYFSLTPPPIEFGVSLPLDYIPQVESNGTFLSDTANWMLIEGCFRAEGGETYVTIGNFHTDADTPFDPNCTSTFQGTYYYLDDIYISEVQPGGIDVDLGNDITSCYFATLDAGISGVDYYWSTGSTDSSITVFTSGPYYLTVYDGCEAGIDSIDVLITNQAPVEINPSSLNICPGGSVSIQLDPNAGDYLWNTGSTASTFTINATGLYIVTLNDGCDISSDSIQVTVVAPPAPFSIGEDTLLCTGSQIELILDPDLGDFEWQNGSNSNSFIITSAGNYAVTISNMCGESSAALSVEEIMPEVLILPVSTYTLCNGQTLEISLDTTLGPYVWQDGTISSDYLITTSGLYSVTMSHYCGPSSDSVLVTASFSPVVDLGDTLFACPGDTLTLTEMVPVSNYLWQDGSTNDSLFVIAPGTYALTIENACGMDSDSVVVLYQNAMIPPNLGPDIHLCPGDDDVLYAANPGANVVWQDGSTADSLLIDTAGTYYITESNNCFSLSDTVIVFSENQSPTIALPNQLTLCQGSVDTLDPGISGVTFLWSDGSQNPTLVISNPGNYSLTITYACGNDADTVQVLDGGPLPSVSLGVDTALCPGETMILNPSSTAVDTWLWPDGSTSPTYTVTDSGTVDVIVANACGVAYDTVAIDLLDATPVLDLGNDTSLCPGESITLSISFPNVNIQWSDGSTNPDLVINSPGTYYASVSNACGISSDTVHVDALVSVPLLDLGPDIPLCPGEEVTLTPGIPNVNYLWQDGSTDTFFLADHDQTIVLTISNACGSATDTLIALLNINGPDVDLGPDILACAGDTVTIMAITANVNFLWQDGSTNSSFTATSSGLVYVQVSNACGSDIDTVSVDIHGVPPTPALGPDTLLCEGTTLMLNSYADAETTSTWQNGSALPTYVVNMPGMYILTESNHCGENADSINVSYQPLPAKINLGPDTVLCPGETLLLTAPSTIDQLMWQDGSSATTLLASQAGSYSLTITNQCGTTSDELMLAYDDHFIILAEDFDYLLCKGDIIVLDVSQPFAASYEWNDGSTNSTLPVTTPGIYIVTITTHCQLGSFDLNVIANDDCEINDDFFIPNVISPNDDNINDVFTISAGPDVQIMSIDGSIFDRWGSLVFSSKENPFTWNGRFNDEDVLPGVFVYAVHVKYIIAGREVSRTLAGDVTVIK